jgi:hypothetical protein
MLSTKSLGISGGFTLGIFIAVLTLLSLIFGVFPGIVGLFSILPLYSVTVMGSVIGFMYGFIFGYIFFHVLAMFYNVLEG